MVMRSLVLLLVAFSISFADWNIADWRVSFSSVIDKFSKMQTVAEKLETAPVAYYGKLIQREYLQREYFDVYNPEFEKNFPEVYQSFMGWSDYKLKRQNDLLTQAPEKLQQVFEQRYSAMNVKGFFLIHDEIRVDKVYDKETKTWVTPKPGEEKKELFSFAYVGPDISQDTSWKISQRMMSHLNEPEEKLMPVRRIFFMDGYSEECYSLVDTSIFENLQYFPHRLKYDVDLNAVNAQTSTLTSAEMLKKNSQKLVKGVGPIRFNAYADLGRPFLVGDFPDFDPVFYLDFGFGVYLGNGFGGIGMSIRNLDAKCDSCGTWDVSANVEFGYLWFKSDYIESGVWGNLGFAAVDVPLHRENEKKKILHDRYFRYGFGVHVEALFPKLIGKPVDSFFEPGIGNRFGVRLKLGMQNVNAPEFGHAKGYSPFISLGFTWHVMRVRY